MEHKLAQSEKKLNDLERYLSKPSKYKGKEFLLIQYAQERITELVEALEKLKGYLSIGSDFFTMDDVRNIVEQALAAYEDGR